MFKVLKLIYFEENGYKKFGWKEQEVVDENRAISLLGQDKIIKVLDENLSIYTTKEDLKSFIKMSYGLEPNEILSTWGTNVPLFEDKCAENNLSYKYGDGKYLIELCKVIEEEKEIFIQNKIISIIRR